MESNVLSSIPGIEYYPIISLVLFFAFFAGLMAWFFRADRTRLAELAEQPLRDGSPDNYTSSLFDIHHQN